MSMQLDVFMYLGRMVKNILAYFASPSSSMSIIGYLRAKTSEIMTEMDTQQQSIIQLARQGAAQIASSSISALVPRISSWGFTGSGADRIICTIAGPVKLISISVCGPDAFTVKIKPTSGTSQQIFTSQYATGFVFNYRPTMVNATSKCFEFRCQDLIAMATESVEIYIYAPPGQVGVLGLSYEEAL